MCNACHCLISFQIPTLFDGEMVFEEARAACTYLVSKYAISPTQKNLYPLQDVTTKAKIDQKLYFDAGTFYATLQADYVSFFPRPQRFHSTNCYFKECGGAQWKSRTFPRAF